MTALTALAVWFGHEKVLAQAQYFGLDASVLEYTTTDYVLRSLDGLLAPMLQLLIIGIAAIWVHVAVREALRRPERSPMLRAIAWAGTSFGVLCVAIGIWVVRTPGALERHAIARPWILALGVVLIVYGPWILRQASSTDQVAGVPMWLRFGFVLVGLVVFLSAFWSFSAYAHNAGTADASALHQKGKLTAFPLVVIYSNQALEVQGPGVEVTQITDSNSMYRWRYSGLRLLVRSADKYFLLPVNWTPDVGTAIVLPDGDGLRFEFHH